MKVRFPERSQRGSKAGASSQQQQQQQRHGLVVGSQECDVRETTAIKSLRRSSNRCKEGQKTDFSAQGRRRVADWLDGASRARVNQRRRRRSDGRLPSGADNGARATRRRSPGLYWHRRRRREARRRRRLKQGFAMGRDSRAAWGCA